VAGDSVSLANKVSRTSWPKAQQSLSAIYHQRLTIWDLGLTYLESIKDNIELDSILPPDSVVHLTSVRSYQQDHGRDKEE